MSPARSSLASALASLLAACASPTPAASPPSPPHAEFLSPDGPSKLPFSAAVRVGDVVYASGQIGNTPADPMHLVDGGIEAETRQALENVKRVLEGSDSSIDRVFKCTVMLADMKEWPAMNAIYATYLPQKPARSSLGATGLALGARVEIECAATARTHRG